VYQERSYRREVTGDLKSQPLKIEESDLMIYYSGSLGDAALRLQQLRRVMTDHIENEPSFRHSLTPLEPLEAEDPLISHMKQAGRTLGVGPMASVAGAVAHYLGEALSPLNDELIIENGGDLYLKSSVPRNIRVHTASSTFPRDLIITIPPQITPLGICTSSGTLGHSLSFGKADAVVVLSRDPLLADAAATALGNMVKSPRDIPAAMAAAKGIPEILGTLILIEDRVGLWGEIHLYHRKEEFHETQNPV